MPLYFYGTTFPYNLNTKRQITCNPTAIWDVNGIVNYYRKKI